MPVRNIVHYGFLKPTAQVQVLQPEQIALILYSFKDSFKVRDAGKDW